MSDISDTIGYFERQLARAEFLADERGRRIVQLEAELAKAQARIAELEKEGKVNMSWAW
jgi:hypothetical protein